jgi:hypothetical protein
LLWHAFVDAVAVYVGQEVGILAAEGLVAIFAIISLGLALRMRQQFEREAETPALPLVESNA